MGYNKMRRELKPVYGYVALQVGGDPEVCKTGSSFDPINRPESTWSDKTWVTVLAFIIKSREQESEWKKLLAQHRVGTGGIEIFRTAPFWDYVMQQLSDFRAQHTFSLPQTVFGGPINIAPVELGVAEPRPVSQVLSLSSVQPHSIVDAEPPRSPYLKVGQKRELQ